MKNNIIHFVPLSDRIKRHIPNSLTCCNLLCGCLGIYFVFQGSLEYAAYLIWLALVFDFLDGSVARMLHVTSPIGKELDSLADMITFGVLPSFIMFNLLSQFWVNPFIPFLSFSIAVFSALRLANFNVDTRQSVDFIGLPTPANALFLSSLVFLKEILPAPVFSAWPLLIISLVFAWLLICPLRMFSLKIKNLTWQSNKIRILFLIISILALIFLQFAGIPLIILTYLLLSLFNQSQTVHN